MNRELLRQCLAPDRVIVVDHDDKEQLFATFAAVAARALPGLSAAQIESRLWDRERIMSTRLTDAVAMPHAQFEEVTTTTVIVALCTAGVNYDARVDQPVRLAVAVVGDPRRHLDHLSAVAGALHAEGVLDAVLDAVEDRRTSEVYSLLLGEVAPSGTGIDDATWTQTNARSLAVWRHALQIAGAVGSRFILLHTSANDARRYRVSGQFDGEVFVLTPEDSGIHPGVEYGHATRRDTAGRLSIALLYALTEQRIQRDDVVVNVYGSHHASVLDTIQVTDVGAAFRLFFSVAGDLDLDAPTQRVMLRVLELSTEIANEGREGKPVGALFVIGNTEVVQRHCQQMLMNPFKGYDAHHRNILDPGLTETVKELSRIDGAFIIRGTGEIESAGTYLRVDVEVPELPAGLGARHAAAAAITAVSEAVGIAISESTRQVSIFRHGRRVMIL